MQESLFVRKITRAEQKYLKRVASSSSNGKEMRKAIAILLSSEGLETKEISFSLKCSTAAIRRWIHCFHETGLGSLSPRPISGRPPKAGEDYQTEADKALQQSPRDLGYDANIWTAELLRGHLALRTKQDVSIRTMFYVLHRLGYRFKRPKLDLRHKQDPKEVVRAKREKATAEKKRRPRRIA